MEIKYLFLFILIIFTISNVTAYFNPNIQTTNQGLFSLDANKYTINTGNNEFEFMIKNKGTSDTYTIKFYLLNQISNISNFNISQNIDSTKYTYSIKYNNIVDYYNYYISTFQPFLIDNDPGKFLIYDNNIIQFIPKRLVNDNEITLNGFQINYYEIIDFDSSSKYLNANSYSQSFENFEFNSNECDNCTLYVEIYNSKKVLTDIFYINTNQIDLVTIEDDSNQVNEEVSNEDEDINTQDEDEENKKEDDNKDNENNFNSINYCVESWECSQWSECIEDKKTRNCEDVNDCGTKTNKPRTYMYCTAENSIENRYLGGINNEENNENMEVSNNSKTEIPSNEIKNNQNFSNLNNLNFYVIIIFLILIISFLFYYKYFKISKKKKRKKSKNLVDKVEDYTKILKDDLERWKK